MTADLAVRVDWRDDAACAGIATDTFFPGEGDTATAVQAKRICAGCPVAAECLEVALTAETGDFGVWGGTTPRERQRIRRERGVGRACKQCGGSRPAGKGRQFCELCRAERDRASRAESQRRAS